MDLVAAATATVIIFMDGAIGRMVCIVAAMGWDWMGCHNNGIAADLATIVRVCCSTSSSIRQSCHFNTTIISFRGVLFGSTLDRCDGHGVLAKSIGSIDEGLIDNVKNEKLPSKEKSFFVF